MVIKGMWALVPKGTLNYRALTSKCTYTYTNGESIQDVHDIGKYWVCPREVFSDKQLIRLQVPVLRLEPQFREAFGTATKTITAEGGPSERAKRVQVQAIDVLMSVKNGVVQLPPGTGKTAIGLQYAQLLRTPTIIVVHTKDLQRQWVDRVTELLELPRERIGLIGGISKTWDYAGKDIVIALIQSLSRSPDRTIPLLAEFGLCIYDEVHHMQGAKYKEALTICAGYRIGLSATPHMNGLESIFLNHIGPIIFQSDETDLVPDVFFVEAQANLTEKARRKIRIGMQIGGIDTERAWTMNEVGTSEINNTIVTLVRQCEKEGRTQLLISDRVAQLKYLHGQLAGSSLLIGETEDSKRKGALLQSPIVCASAIPATEGVDRKDFDTLHICLPWAGRNRFIQGTGRILRNCEGKGTPHVYAYDPIDVPLLHGTFENFRRNVHRYGYRSRTIGYTLP